MGSFFFFYFLIFFSFVSLFLCLFSSSNVWLVDKHQGTKGTDRKEVEDAHPKSIFFFGSSFWLEKRTTTTTTNSSTFCTHTHISLYTTTEKKNKKNKIVKRKESVSHKHGRERYFALGKSLIWHLFRVRFFLYFLFF